MKSPIALLSDLLDDSSRLNPGVKGLKRDVITLENRFKHEGYGFLTITLPSLDGALLRGLASGRFSCPSGFKCIRGGTIPRFLSGMFSEVFDPVTGLLKETPDVGVLKALHGVLLLFKKMRLSTEDEDSLHLKAVDEFYQCDESAGQVVIPDRHDHLIGRVCSYILNPLKQETNYETYKHGPGAVKEGYTANQKWEAVSRSVIADRDALPSWAGFSEFLVSTLRASEVCTERRPRSRVKRESPRNSRTSLRSSALSSFDSVARLASAKLISVPKNSTARRTITIEPVLNQFLQQGLNTQLRRSIDRCGVLSKCIALTQQVHNQKLALEGSRYGNWATIDLKSASDLMSMTLVKSVFRHHADFYQHMIDCRSPSVECSEKEPLTLGKFAGMGNALTFPVQSIVFAVIAICGILDAQGVSPSYWNMRRASRHIRVYGDDIIVSHLYAHQVVDWLQQVGLRINLKKSFLEGNFRESCGVDAWRGEDITPLYIGYRPDQQIVDSPSVIANFVSLSNRLWLDGCYKASTCLRELVENAIGSVLPLVSRESGSLGWHSRQDAVEPHKWCRRTHRFLTRTLALVPIKRDDRLDGYAALLKCFHMPRKEYVGGFGMPDILAWDTDHLSKTTMRYKTRIVRRWVPSQFVEVKSEDF